LGTPRDGARKGTLAGNPIHRNIRRTVAGSKIVQISFIRAPQAGQGSASNPNDHRLRGAIEFEKATNCGVTTQCYDKRFVT